MFPAAEYTFTEMEPLLNAGGDGIVVDGFAGCWRCCPFAGETKTNGKSAARNKGCGFDLIAAPICDGVRRGAIPYEAV
jgi:hypothetical protein